MSGTKNVKAMIIHEKISFPVMEFSILGCKSPAATAKIVIGAIMGVECFKLKVFCQMILKTQILTAPYIKNEIAQTNSKKASSLPKKSPMLTILVS